MDFGYRVEPPVPGDMSPEAFLVRVLRLPRKWSFGSPSCRLNSLASQKHSHKSGSLMVTASRCSGLAVSMSKI